MSNAVRHVVSVIGPSIAYVPLTKGYYSAIDQEDVARVTGHKWCIVPRQHGSERHYAAANMKFEGKWHRVFMHRFLLGLEFGDKRTADHRNLESLDNRRFGNLRIADAFQQMANTPKRDNKSGFRGVEPKHGRFIARISTRGKKIRLGTFDTAEEASRVYAKAAKEFHGEFARTE
jgi:hypothetical protein